MSELGSKNSLGQLAGNVAPRPIPTDGNLTHPPYEDLPPELWKGVSKQIERISKGHGGKMRPWRSQPMYTPTSNEMKLILKSLMDDQYLKYHLDDEHVTEHLALFSSGVHPLQRQIYTNSLRGDLKISEISRDFIFNSIKGFRYKEFTLDIIFLAKEILADRKAKQESRAAAEDERSYYKFFEIRGIVYALRKYKERSGNKIVSNTEFFVQRSGVSDEHILLNGYDIPLADGQAVSIIYGGCYSKSSYLPIRVGNLNTQSFWKLNENFETMARTANGMPRMGFSRRFAYEFDRYLSCRK